MSNSPQNSRDSAVPRNTDDVMKPVDMVHRHVDTVNTYAPIDIPDPSTAPLQINQHSNMMDIEQSADMFNMDAIPLPADSFVVNESEPSTELVEVGPSADIGEHDYIIIRQYDYLLIDNTIVWIYMINSNDHILKLFV